MKTSWLADRYWLVPVTEVHSGNYKKKIQNFIFWKKKPPIFSVKNTHNSVFLLHHRTMFKYLLKKS